MRRSRTRKDPLNFVYLKKNAPRLVEGLAQLTKEQIETLGPCDPNWFEKASKKCVCDEKEPTNVDNSAVLTDETSSKSSQESLLSLSSTDTSELVLNQCTPVQNVKTFYQHENLPSSAKNSDILSPLSLLLDSSDIKKCKAQLASTPLPSLHTDKDLAFLKSLGLDANQTEVSWTSSLATTPKHRTVSKHPGNSESTVSKNFPEDETFTTQLPTAARALFTTDCPEDSDTFEGLCFLELNKSADINNQTITNGNVISASGDKGQNGAQVGFECCGIAEQFSSSLKTENMLADGVSSHSALCKSSSENSSLQDKKFMTQPSDSADAATSGIGHDETGLESVALDPADANSTKLKDDSQNSETVDDILSLFDNKSGDCCIKKSVPRRRKVNHSKRVNLLLSQNEDDSLCEKNHSQPLITKLMEESGFEECNENEDPVLNNKSFSKVLTSSAEIMGGTNQFIKEEFSSEECSEPLKPTNKSPVQTTQTKQGGNVSNEAGIKDEISSADGLLVTNNATNPFSGSSVCSQRKLTPLNSGHRENVNMPSYKETSGLKQECHDVYKRNTKSKGIPAECNVQAVSASSFSCSVKPVEATASSSVGDEITYSGLGSASTKSALVSSVPKIISSVLSSSPVGPESKTALQESHLKKSTPTSSSRSANLLSKLRQKTRRFSYPSIAQISETSPKVIFNLKDTASRTDPEQTRIGPTVKEAVTSNMIGNETLKDTKPCQKLPWSRSPGFINLTTYKEKILPDGPVSVKADTLKRKRDTNQDEHCVKKTRLSWPQHGLTITECHSEDNHECASSPKKIDSKLTTITDVTESDQKEAENLLSEFGNELLIETQFTQIPAGPSSVHSDELDLKSEISDGESECMYPLAENIQTETEGEKENVSEIHLQRTVLKQEIERFDSVVKERKGFTLLSNLKNCMDKMNLPEESTSERLKADCDVSKSGFQCASGKAIGIKQENLKRFASWLEDDLPEIYPQKDVSHRDVSSPVQMAEHCSEDAASQAFKSVSGKNLLMNKAAFSKHECRPQDDDNDYKLDADFKIDEPIGMETACGTVMHTLSGVTHNNNHQITKHQLDGKMLECVNISKSNSQLHGKQSTQTYDNDKPCAALQKEIVLKKATCHADDNRRKDEGKSKTLSGLGDKSNVAGENELTNSQISEATRDLADYFDHDTSLSEIQPSLKIRDQVDVEEQQSTGMPKVASVNPSENETKHILPEKCNFKLGGEEMHSRRPTCKDVAGFVKANGGTIQISNAAMEKAKCLLDATDNIQECSADMDDDDILLKAVESLSDQEKGEQFQKTWHKRRKLDNDKKDCCVYKSELVQFKTSLIEQNVVGDGLHISDDNRCEQASVRSESGIDTNIITNSGCFENKCVMSDRCPSKQADSRPKPDVVNVMGFTTAGGTSLPVSFAAMKKATKLMTRIEKECREESLTDEARKNDPNNPNSNNVSANNQQHLTESEPSEVSLNMKTNANVVTADTGTITTCKKITGFLSGRSINSIQVDGSDTTGCSVLNDVHIAPVLYDNGDSLIEKSMQAASVNSPMSDATVDLTKNIRDLKKDKPDNFHNLYIKGGFPGFQTAKGDKVTISAKSLLAAKSMLDDVDTPEEGDQDNDKPTSKCPSFQTAKGNKVSISETALQEAKTFLCSDTDNLLVCNQEDNVAAEKNVSTKPVADVRSSSSNCTGKCTPFMGFHTARGNKVNVSAKNLVAAKKLLNDGSDVDGTWLHTGKGQNEMSSASANHHSSIASHGCTSAEQGVGSGDVSQQTGEAFSEKDRLQHSAEPGREQNGGDDGQFPGFRTAKGRNLKISATALNAANDLFTEIKSDSDLRDLGTKLDQTKRRDTDNGLPKVKSPLEDKANLLPKSKAKKSSFLGFQTAKGEGVNVSVDSLSVAKQLLDESSTLQGESIDHSSHSHSFVDQSSVCHESKQSEILASDTHTGITLGQKSETPPSYGCTTGDDPQCTEQEESSELSEQELSLTQETLESVKALLSDGDFGMDILEMGQSHKRPVTLTPEEIFADRDIKNRVKVQQSIVTSPASDIIRKHDASPSLDLYNWMGPTKYKTFNTKQKLLKGKTKSYSLGAVTPAQDDSGKDDTDKRCHIDNTKSTSFRTPYKKPSSETVLSETVNRAVKFETPYRTSKRCDDPVPSTCKTLSVDRDGNRQSGEVQQTGDFSSTSDDSVDNVGNEGFKTEWSDQEPDVVISDEVKKSRLRAKIAQIKNIKLKEQKRDTRPAPGQLYIKKSEGSKIPLKEAVQGQRPRSYTRQQLYSFGVKTRTLGVRSSNAEDFTFLASDYYGVDAMRCWDGVPTGDGGYLVFSDDGTIGKKELCNCLLAMPGVEPRFISKEWVYNHYKWIVWKLAAMEVSFPHQFGGRLLSPDQVLLQLKYRYDREVDHSERSALKKIYEKDDSPHKLLILCVSDVTCVNNQPSSAGKSTSTKPNVAVLTLTDGWYSIKAVTDGPLTELVQQAKITVGDKLCVYGADFVGQHEACSPLDAVGDVMLRLSANCTRRARWHTKLGFFTKPIAPTFPLSSLHPEGGMVGCIDVMVTRVYPIQYLEKLPDGSTVWRSSRGEEKAAQEFCRKHQQRLEKLCQNLEEEVTTQMLGGQAKKKLSNKRWTWQEVSKLEDGAEIYEAITEALDPSSIEMHLSCSQQRALSSYQQQKHDDLQAEIRAEIQKRINETESECASRDVTPVLKVRLAGCCSRDIDTSMNAILTIWRPAEDISSVLVEGQRMKIYNLTARPNRGSLGISLSTSRSTRYQAVDTDDNLRDLIYEPREVILSTELADGAHIPYGEFDTVGLVVKVSTGNHLDRHGSTERHVEIIHLADAEGSILAIKLWGGLKAHYIEDIVHEGVWLACSNLQWKSGRHGPWLSATATDLTHFTTKPKQTQLQAALRQLQDRIKAPRSYITDMKKRISNAFRSTLQSRKLD